MSKELDFLSAEKIRNTSLQPGTYYRTLSQIEVHEHDPKSYKYSEVKNFTIDKDTTIVILDAKTEVYEDYFVLRVVALHNAQKVEFYILRTNFVDVLSEEKID